MPITNTYCGAAGKGREYPRKHKKKSYEIKLRLGFRVAESALENRQQIKEALIRFFEHEVFPDIKKRDHEKAEWELQTITEDIKIKNKTEVETETRDGILLVRSSVTLCADIITYAPVNAITAFHTARHVIADNISDKILSQLK